MKHVKTSVVAMAVAALIMLPLSLSCSSSSGADIYLEDVSIGSLSSGGKPISGLPVQGVNIVIKAKTTKVMVSQSGGTTTITLQPSGAVITSSSDGISFTGIEADQIEIKWNTTTTK
ncbi:MAG: hypothetical protein PHY03_07305 [Dehalococcoidia bacterium]|nr:hypothetical protein [Dehalococcoidia bacterium]